MRAYALAGAVLTEPDVALTDYGLALECGCFVYILWRRIAGDRALRGWFMLFFGSVGAAALAGGTVHGFFSGAATIGARLLWSATMLALGATALASWAAGARLVFGPRVARGVVMAAVAEYVAYAAAGLYVTQAFALAVLNYLPALVFLVIVFALEFRRTREPRVGGALAGLALTLAGSWIQQRGLALHPRYFDHNAVYHSVEALALLLVFGGVQSLLTVRAGGAAGSC